MFLNACICCNRMNHLRLTAREGNDCRMLQI
jgi:hypothetical protein